MGHIRFLRSLANRLRRKTSAPAAPSNLAAFQRNGVSLILTWTDNSADETSFSIEQDGAVVATPAANATSATISSLTAGQAYSFRMRAFNGLYSAYTSNVAATPSYQKGYPGFANNVSQANVAAQWLFAEGSGDIVDAVAGFTVTQVSSPTYSQTLTGAYAGISPGITVTGGAFATTSNPTAIAIGTGDATFEGWLKFDANVSGDRGFFITDSAAAKGMYFYIRTSDSTLRGFWKADTGETLNFTAPFTTTFIGDGVAHKYRYVLTRAGNFVIYEDGVSIYSASAAAISGKTLSTANLQIGAFDTSAPAGDRFNGKFYEMRVSLNATNNSGGPGGG